MNISNSAIKFAYNKGYRINNMGDVFFNSKLRKQNYDRKGYARFGIKDTRKKSVNIYTHRLQAYQKFGDKMFKDEIQVRHLDGNCKNNRYNNIGIGTASENMFDIPREKRVLGAIYAASHLSKKVLAGGIEFNSYSEAGRYFGISDNGIRKRIKLGWSGYKKIAL